MIITFLLAFYAVLKSPEFLLLVMAASVAAKFYFLSIVFPNQHVSFRSIKLISILVTLAASLFGDVAWVVKMLHSFGWLYVDYPTVIFFVRIAWAFLLIQYQSLYIFMQSITQKKAALKKSTIALCCATTVQALYFTYLAFLCPNTLVVQAERMLAKQSGHCFEYQMMAYVTLYILIALNIPALLEVLLKVKNQTIPKIIYQQLKTFIFYFLIPFVAIETLLGLHQNASDIELYPIVSISTILLNVMIYYCLTHVIKLRFLEKQAHVQSHQNPNVINSFKQTLEMLGKTSNLNELSYICQRHCKELFGVPLRSVTLTIRNGIQNQHELDFDAARNDRIIEQFLLLQNQNTLTQLMQKKILVYNEIAFDDYFNDESIITTFLTFLNSINSDIFIPLYTKKKIIGYITIARDARTECYGQSDCNTLLVFANYLAHVIHNLQHENAHAIMHQEQSLKQELYQRHQEINQYKESIDAVLRANHNKSIGIIFYKKNLFTLGNQATVDILGVHPNDNPGHPVCKQLLELAKQVEEHATAQTKCIRNSNGRLVIFSAIPNLQTKNVIITVFYPDVSDIVSHHINYLDNPNDWDYLLYLENTKAGQLVNQFIPGITSALLNIKIQLLKLALSKKPTLLDAADEDVMPLTQLIHHISLGERLFTLSLNQHTRPQDMAVRLFGSPFATEQEPIFCLLKNNSTLFIKNIHYLDQETQSYLAHYLNYGVYRAYKSEETYPSTIRVICSSNQDLSELVHSGTFNTDLYNQLKNNSITFPTLSFLNHGDITSLIEGLTSQAIANHEYKQLVNLNEKDKRRLTESGIVSFVELKNKIHQLLLKKSKETDLDSKELLDPGFTTSDPELAPVARLGKHALKDPKIMALLWRKFKNQNKIALFLGVNRSSVHRRFKLYNLTHEQGTTA